MQNSTEGAVEEAVEDLFTSPAEGEVVDQAERYLRKPNGTSDQGHRED